MVVRAFLPSDYSLLANWWRDWELPVAPIEFLPTDSGLIVMSGFLPVCAGFLYQLGDTPMFWIESVVSNPNVEKEVRTEALGHLIGGLADKAKEMDCELLMGSTPREGLAQIFQEQGFGQAPEKYVHVARRI